MGGYKLAVVYGGICGGCDVSLINTVSKDLNSFIERFDIVFWPIALDAKLEVLEKTESIDASIYMGTVRTEEHLRLAQLVRRKSKIVVAYGSCAAFGGIPGLGATLEPEAMLSIVNSTVTVNVRPNLNPSGELKPPKLLSTELMINSYALNALKPDIIAPGCPPEDGVNEKLMMILKESLEGRNNGVTVVGDEESLCRNCPRKPADLTKIKMPTIRRLHEVKVDETRCFLEQGILCMGPATRAGCGHPCLKNNSPCVGCMGPAPGVDDFGLKILSSISSIIAIDKEKELLETGLSKELDRIVDPLGSFYRYTFPTSTISQLLKKRG